MRDRPPHRRPGMVWRPAQDITAGGWGPHSKKVKKSKSYWGWGGEDIPAISTTLHSHTHMCCTGTCVRLKAPNPNTLVVFSAHACTSTSPCHLPKVPQVGRWVPSGHEHCPKARTAVHKYACPPAEMRLPGMSHAQDRSCLFAKQVPPSNLPSTPATCPLRTPGTLQDPQNHYIAAVATARPNPFQHKQEGSLNCLQSTHTTTPELCCHAVLNKESAVH